MLETETVDYIIKILNNIYGSKKVLGTNFKMNVTEELDDRIRRILQDSKL